MAVSSPRPEHRKAPRAGAVKTGRQAHAKRLGLDSPEHGAMLRRAGYSQFRRPVSFLLSRTGVMVLSGVSKSCRNMAAGAGAAMSRTRSPVKGPATKEARSPEPRPSGTGEIKLLNYGSYAGFAQARRSQVRIPPFLPL